VLLCSPADGTDAHVSTAIGDDLPSSAASWAHGHAELPQLSRHLGRIQSDQRTHLGRALARLVELSHLLVPGGVALSRFAIWTLVVATGFQPSVPIPTNTHVVLLAHRRVLGTDAVLAAVDDADHDGSCAIALRAASIASSHVSNWRDLIIPTGLFPIERYQCPDSPHQT
jgi:hypothetical protein